MLGWLGRQRSGGGAGADKPTARAPALGGLLVALGLRGREPTLPVRTKRPHGSSPGTPAGGKKQQQQQQGRGGLQQRCVFLLAFLFFAAAVATATAAAAVSLYVHSILHEPPAVLAAATAEVHAAVAAAAAARAAAGFAPAAAPAPPAALLADPLQPPDPAEPEALGDEEQEQDRQRAQALFTGNYTVVVMSYSARLWGLPLVVNKLGSCPSVAEVLVVWNGDGAPDPSLFNTSAPVRIRREAKNDLSNRLRPDEDIQTAAVFLADDDVLLRCADVERAFARWQAAQQALVGFFPRLATPGPPAQYLGEREVFRRGQYNTLLTAGEFVSLHLLRRYFMPQFERGRELVSRRGNCEDILLNIVAATAIQEHSLQPGAASSSPGGPGGRRLLLGEVEPPERRLPQAVWVQPSRRLDISLLSGVGISRAAQHAAQRRRCVAQFAKWYGDVLQVERIDWGQGGGGEGGGSAAQGRLLERPLCGLPFLGCVYL